MMTRITAFLLAFCIGANAADELTLNAGFSYKKGNANFARNAYGIISDVYGSEVQHSILNVYTNTETLISLGTVTNAGYALFVNLSTNEANWIQLGPTGAVNIAKMRGSECSLFRMATNAINVKAYGANQELEYWIIAD